MQKYDDEERQLKSWRREKVNLSKIETDDPEMKAKIDELTSKIAIKEKELAEDLKLREKFKRKIYHIDKV